MKSNRQLLYLFLYVMYHVCRYRTRFTTTMTILCCIILCQMSLPLLNRCDAFRSLPKRLDPIHHNINNNNNKRAFKRFNECSQKFNQSRKISVRNGLPAITSTKLYFSNSPTDWNPLYEHQHHTASDVLSSLKSCYEIKSDHTISTMTLSLNSFQSPPLLENDWIVPIIVMVALTIGILANGWISRLLSGEQGLGSYLSDGSGYNKSKFKPLQPQKSGTNMDRAVQGDDPLPWLRLPNLDFVEVAGQNNRPRTARSTTSSKGTTMASSTITVNDNTMENASSSSETNTIALEELELLRLRLQEQLLLGNIEQAKQIQSTLERLMKENNIEFTKEMEPFE